MVLSPLRFEGGSFFGIHSGCLRIVVYHEKQAPTAPFVGCLVGRTGKGSLPCLRVPLREF